jgi:citrate lyase beta subunit
MTADRTAYSFAPTPEEVEDADAILRDLEEIIYETFPPDQAEAAYAAALQHLLKAVGGDTILATDQLFERVMRRR